MLISSRKPPFFDMRKNKLKLKANFDASNLTSPINDYHRTVLAKSAVLTLAAKRKIYVHRIWIQYIHAEGRTDIDNVSNAFLLL